MEFAKLHALGNDFIIMKVGDPDSTPGKLSPLAIELCNRRCGIGADGVLFYKRTIGDPDAGFSALIVNADGTKAEMSGNGIRCLAAWLIHSREQESGRIRIRTVSGIKIVTLKEREGRIYQLECSMGHPITDPRVVPALIGEGEGPLLDFPLAVGQEVYRVSISSLGNPHCTTFWDDVSKAPVETLGPKLERHTAFPNRTNVEFVQKAGSNMLKVRFWERGVGMTLASGTGSSAAAVAAMLLGHVSSPVTVQTALGSMQVRWQAGEELFLAGSATVICSGHFLGNDAGSGA